MLNESDVRTAMRAQLKTVSTLPDDIMWQNHSWRPPDHPASTGPVQLWVRENQRVLEERKTSTGFIQTLGQTDYYVYAPRGRGTREIDDLTHDIATAFQPTQNLNGDETTITIVRTSRQPLGGDDNHPSWVVKGVSILWRAFTAVSA